jgi:protein tyrosine/serine phosphatase
LSFAARNPNADGIKELKELGITTIVDLRGERQGTVKTERARAEAAGNAAGQHSRARLVAPEPTNNWLSSSHSSASDRQETLYVHCWLGDDRTGVVSCHLSHSFRTLDSRAGLLREMYFFHI